MKPITAIDRRDIVVPLSVRRQGAIARGSKLETGTHRNASAVEIIAYPDANVTVRRADAQRRHQKAVRALRELQTCHASHPRDR